MPELRGIVPGLGQTIISSLASRKRIEILHAEDETAGRVRRFFGLLNPIFVAFEISERQWEEVSRRSRTADRRRQAWALIDAYLQDSRVGRSGDSIRCTGELYRELALLTLLHADEERERIEAVAREEVGLDTLEKHKHLAMLYLASGNHEMMLDDTRLWRHLLLGHHLAT